LGIVKQNHSDGRTALCEGMMAEQGALPPDVQEWSRHHGRRDVREEWRVEADDAMRTYLEQEWGWPDVRWDRRVRRQRAPLHAET